MPQRNVVLGPPSLAGHGFCLEGKTAISNLTDNDTSADYDTASSSSESSQTTDSPHPNPDNTDITKKPSGTPRHRKKKNTSKKMVQAGGRTEASSCGTSDG